MERKKDVITIDEKCPPVNGREALPDTKSAAIQIINIRDETCRAERRKRSSMKD